MTADDPPRHQPPQLRLISRELATLRLRLAEDRIAGRTDADTIEQLPADIARLGAVLRRSAHQPS